MRLRAEKRQVREACSNIHYGLIILVGEVRNLKFFEIMRVSATGLVTVHSGEEAKAWLWLSPLDSRGR